MDVLAAKNPRYVSSAEAESLVSAIGNFPSCHALQRHGFSFLAQLLANQQASPKSAKLQDASFALPGGGLARIITRLGVADLALSALVLHQDEVLFHDVCFLLQLLAPSSREVKMSKTQFEAMQKKQRFLCFLVDGYISHISHALPKKYMKTIVVVFDLWFLDLDQSYKLFFWVNFLKPRSWNVDFCSPQKKTWQKKGQQKKQQQTNAPLLMTQITTLCLRLILQKGEKLWLRALAQKSRLPSGPVLAMWGAPGRWVGRVAWQSFHP